MEAGPHPGPLESALAKRCRAERWDTREDWRIADAAIYGLKGWKRVTWRVRAWAVTVTRWRGRSASRFGDKSATRAEL